MRISLIVAMDKHRLIGNEAGLPWHLPSDLKRFRELTTGKPIILGRKTYEQIGRPLPERLNIVLTRQADYVAAGCSVVRTIEGALAVAEAALPNLGADEIMIVGGAEVYRQAIPFAQRCYLTVVDGEFRGNAWFPDVPPFRGRAIREETYPADEKTQHSHRFLIVDHDESGVLLETLIG